MGDLEPARIRRGKDQERRGHRAGGGVLGFRQPLRIVQVHYPGVYASRTLQHVGFGVPLFGKPPHCDEKALCVPVNNTHECLCFIFGKLGVIRPKIVLHLKIYFVFSLFQFLRSEFFINRL